MKNSFSLIVDANLKNEAFIRNSLASFILPLNPTVAELNDIKTAVSEAITNCIVHGYNGGQGKIYIDCSEEDSFVEIIIKDHGVGIDNIKKAREPFFTTKASEERSGMGFTLMETFMDSLDVLNAENGGVIVKMTKQIHG